MTIITELMLILYFSNKWASEKHQKLKGRFGCKLIIVRHAEWHKLTIIIYEIILIVWLYEYIKLYAQELHILFGVPNMGITQN